jgi:hypothetical protein
MEDQEKYKINSIFKYIKTGKFPKRKGLFKTIFYLAGRSECFLGILGTSSSLTKLRPDKNRYALLKIENFRTILPQIQPFFEKYIKNFTFEERNDSPYYLKVNYVDIYYNHESINWALIDEELKKNHANNITIKDGIPKIINYKNAK